MKLINEIRLYFRCEQMLNYARIYKSKKDERYYRAFHTQIRLYEDLKKGITNNIMLNSLSKLEQEVLKDE